MRAPRRGWALAVLALLVLAACGGGEPGGAGSGPGGPGSGRPRPGGSGGPQGAGGGRGGFGPGGAPPAAAVPVEVAPVERRSISAFIETNGTLEAENEVDIVARVSAPVVELRAEEGMAVKAGQILARLDPNEIRAQYEISRVNLEETKLAFERAERLKGNQLISPEEYEQAFSRHETAKAELEKNQIQLGYTEIRAPFGGLIVARYVDQAQQVSPNTPLFRISDFDPLLCPIQVPERELPRLRVGQPAYLTVESWPSERFNATVLRVRPVVDAATGTVRVTLDVQGQGRLRPGMFARVYLETATRSDALVIPRSALSLESIGDTLYVAEDGVARRREVTLGFEERNVVEVRSGVAAGELVVVVGQDGLSDGTPIQVLRGPGSEPAAGTGAEPGAQSRARGGGDRP
jgi:membrane fusion protein, multidrug efflux system